MFHSKSTHLALALAVACCTLAAIASVGADEAWAGDCSSSFVFNLGAANTCNSTTSLTSTGSGIQVTSQLANGFALFGFNSASSGQSWGVSGETFSSGTNAAGTGGYLNTFTPGSGSGVLTSAGIFGRSDSTTAYGPAVFGIHSS